MKEKKGKRKRRGELFGGRGAWVVRRIGLHSNYARLI